MTIVSRAVQFVKGLLTPPSRPVCPRCGGTLWNRHGFSNRGKRCLDDLDPDVAIQRYRCTRCGKTWSDKPAWLAPRKWYGRDVIRMSLDLAMDCTTSWRELGSMVHGIVTGAGRAVRWAPWRQPKEGSEPIKLAHTTVWRWFQEAGKRAGQEDRVAERYQGLFSGVLATDESWGWIKGIVEGVGRKVGFGVQALVDGKTRLVLNLRRLANETEEELRAGVEQLVRRGIGLKSIRAWRSDGRQTDPAIWAMRDLGAVPWQRSIFHLWRNLAGGLKAYAAAKGQQAGDRLRDQIRAVWDAPSERAAVVALMTLVQEYGDDPLAGRLVRVVRSTFKEATFHLKGMVAGLARTSGVVEWVWRRYKRRLRLLQCFMSDDGADNFFRLDELHINFHRYQIRKERKRVYPYPGKCPLEIAAAEIEVEVDGRRVAATWMDALAI
ncbi:MAG: IS1 family transposase [Chloroflexi bacterium]|nr:IS1 family transposase [Chloroflexota bacterium]